MRGELFESKEGCVFLKFCTSFTPVPFMRRTRAEYERGERWVFSPFSTIHATKQKQLLSHRTLKFCIIQQCPLRWKRLQIAANKSLCAQVPPPLFFGYRQAVKLGLECVLCSSLPPLDPTDTHNVTTTFSLSLSIKPLTRLTWMYVSNHCPRDCIHINERGSVSESASRAQSRQC